MTRKILAIIAAAICTLAITATAFAAEFINADQARSIAAQWVPAGSTHLVTKDESHKYAAYYEVKFYDNATNTEYEVEVLKNGGAVKEFKMDAQTVLGSPRVVLSAADVQDLVRKEFPNATFTKVKLDSDLHFSKQSRKNPPSSSVSRRHTAKYRSYCECQSAC